MGTRKIPVNVTKLLELRHRKGWTQEQLAALSECSHRTIQEVERTGLATAEILDAIARRFGLKLEDLEMTPADVLQKKISELIQSSGVVAEVRQTLGKEATVVVSVIVIGGSSVALLFALSGFFPINARPYYWAGVCLAAVALGTAILARRRPVLPIVAVASTTLAIAAWPHAFGLFSSPKGYQLRFGDRSKLDVVDGNLVYGDLNVSFGGTYSQLEPITIRCELPNGKKGVLWHGFNIGRDTASHAIRDIEANKQCKVTIEVALREMVVEYVTIRPGKEGTTNCVLVIPPHAVSTNAYVGINVYGTKYNKLSDEQRDLPIFVDGVMVGTTRTHLFVEVTPRVKHSIAVEFEGRRYQIEKSFLPANTPDNLIRDHDINNATFSLDDDSGGSR